MPPLTLVAALLLALAPPADAPAGAPPLAVGDVVPLYTEAADGCIPVLETEAHYAGFLGLCRRGVLPNPNPWTNPYLGKFRVPGRSVRVLSLHDDPAYPLNAPAARVEVLAGPGAGDVDWIAQQYLRPRGSSHPEGEAKLPTFRFRPVKGYVPGPDDEMNLFATDRPTVPAALDRGGLEVVARALAAETKGDDVARVEDTRVVEVPVYSRVRVLDRVSRPIPAYRVRLLAGDTLEGGRGETAWVPARFVVRLHVTMGKARRR